MKEYVKYKVGMAEYLKFNLIIGCLLVALINGCTNPANDEYLARKYCSNCHAFPDPLLLPRNIWVESVLPEMGFRMGLKKFAGRYSDEDKNEVLKTIPTNPMVTESEWKAIKNYYSRNSPLSISIQDTITEKSISQFEISTFKLPIKSFPLTTLLQFDTISKKIFIGNRYGRLYQLHSKLILEDSFQLKSAPSYMLFSESHNPMISLMGIMDPNDQALGELTTLHLSTKESETIIDSLKRPVHLQYEDLNSDGLKEFIICAFGNYSGSILIYEPDEHQGYKKHVLHNLPGARKVIVKDFNNDKKLDVLALMAQGDEKIILFTNQGDFQFQSKTLLRFPPVYGSSYFDVVDFNNDGLLDILYTNGDNADYSIIKKPYHGVRIFLQEGKQQFKESWFYPMMGASQGIAADFDNDGDVDIAAIAFFADFENHPERSFIYFENDGNKLIPQTTLLAALGRWIVLEKADIDSDGDDDIMLGSLAFQSGVKNEVYRKWEKNQISILVLRNILEKTQRK